ncbi:VanW family protein [Paenibacillus albus]|uniref:G5 domain-containing protein n=1 Tax=Paenibacillus albus TaxID=2495582 RepID=A0A3S9ACA3_9BACL|nr:VanW family protein [Paenibacillus albus]AZN43344.1 hypothetical protein EJC50_29380 [Paenibacillus albus]
MKMAKKLAVALCIASLSCTYTQLSSAETVETKGGADYTTASPDVKKQMEADKKRIAQTEGFKLSEFKRTQDVIKDLLAQGKDISYQEGYLKQLLELSGEDKLVSQSAIAFGDTSGLLTKWTEFLNGTVIEPKHAFSLLGALEELQPADSNALSVLATGIYSVVLKSNFSLLERSIGRSLPDYDKFGYEAKMVPGHVDLKFANTNDTPYKLFLEYYNGVLYTYLAGAPLETTYRITMEDEQIIAPRTVKQFKATGGNGGKPGVYAVIYRLTVDANNAVIKKERISEDYYAPVNRIESTVRSEGGQDETAGKTAR